MRSIISISLSGLENIGLSKVVESVPSAKFSVADADDYAHLDLAKYDLIITAPDFLAREIDSFLSIKEKVIVVVQGNTESIGGTFRCVCADASYQEFIGCIASALENNIVAENSHKLSSREVEVLTQLASGKTQKEIAEMLCISTTTVVTHRKNISTKLGIRSISGLALYAAINGYVK